MLIRESGVGRAVGIHQSSPAAELGVGPSAMVSTSRSSDTRVTFLRRRYERGVGVTAHVPRSAG
jgi:hypothetical protein